MKAKIVKISVLLFIVMNSICAYSQIGKCKGKYLGNIIAYSTPSNYTSIWNQVTSENGSKWGSVEGTKGTYNFSNSDLSYNWAKNNGGLFKYHCLVWGSQTPSWVETASTTTIQTAIEDYIKAVANHYASMGGINILDVLNEPVNTSMPGNMKAALTVGYQADPANASDLNNQYGWVIWSFQLARKYFPNAVLLINEFNIEMNWNSCRTPYIAMANAVKNAPNLTDGKKNLIDGVGLQCHGIENLTATNFKACIDEIWTKTGLPVHITEFDIQADPNEAKQQTQYLTLIPVAWEHAHVAGITLWGYIQGTTWRNGNGTAGPSGTDSGILYSSNYTTIPLGERPAMTWLKQYFTSQTSLSCCPAPAPFATCSNNIAPAVTLTAPTNNTTFSSGSIVSLTAIASDADGTITKVEFYQGATLLSSDNTLPYTYSWTNATDGSYSITAKAYDELNVITTSTAVNIIVGTPTVVNLVNNPEFDNSTTNWDMQYNNSTAGTFKVVTNSALSGTNAAEVCPTTAGNADWNVQLRQNVPITAGKTYEISFMAKAAAARTMAVACQPDVDPYPIYFSQSVNLTTSAQSYSFTYTPTTTDAVAKLKFFVGNSTSCVYIDKVMITEVLVTEVEKNNESFIIYPNPATDKIILNSQFSIFNDKSNTEIQIINTVGQTVFNSKLKIEDSKLEINISQFPTGLYFIKVGVEVQKFIKQ